MIKSQTLLKQTSHNKLVIQFLQNTDKNIKTCLLYQILTQFFHLVESISNIFTNDHCNIKYIQNYIILKKCVFFIYIFVIQENIDNINLNQDLSASYHRQMNNFSSYPYRNYSDLRYPSNLSEITPQRAQTGFSDKNSASRVQKVANKIEEIIEMCERQNPDGSEQLTQLIKAQKGILNILTKSQVQNKNPVGGKSQVQQITSQVRINDSQHPNSPTKKRPSSQTGVILGQQALLMIEQIESKALKQIQILKKQKAQLEKAFQETLKEYNLQKKRRLWLQSQLQKLLQYLQQNSLGLNFKFPQWYQQGMTEVQKLKIPEFSAQASQVNTNVNASQSNSPQVGKQNISVQNNQNYTESINQHNVNTSNTQFQKGAQNQIDQQHIQQIFNQQKEYQQQIHKQQQQYFQQLNEQQQQYNQQLAQTQQLYQKQIQQYQQQLKQQRQQFNNSQKQIQDQHQQQYEQLTRSMKLQQQTYQNQLNQQLHHNQLNQRKNQSQSQYQANNQFNQQNLNQQQYQPNQQVQQPNQYPIDQNYNQHPSYNASNQRKPVTNKSIYHNNTQQQYQTGYQPLYQDQIFPFATGNTTTQQVYEQNYGPRHINENQGQKNVMGQFRNQIQDLKSYNNYISQNIETQNVELQRRLAQAQKMANAYFSEMQRWRTEEQRMNQVPGLRELLQQGERIRQQTLHLLRLKNQQVGRGQTFGIPGGRRNYGN